jgi:hypothetical protein
MNKGLTAEDFRSGFVESRADQIQGNRSASSTILNRQGRSLRVREQTECSSERNTLLEQQSAIWLLLSYPRVDLETTEPLFDAGAFCDSVSSSTLRKPISSNSGVKKVYLYTYPI